MEIVERVYKGGNNSKNNNRAESDHVSHVRKLKGGEAASPTNPKKGRVDNHKKNNAGHLSDCPTSTIMTCLLHGPGKSTEE